MVWVWLGLLLGVCVEANSNGVGLPCNVDPGNLGSTQRTTKNPNLNMWWVWPPQFAGNQYTLRTADPSTVGDPTTYTPGQWTNIYIRTNLQDQQYTGLVLYATNSADQKVGSWQVPFGAPFHTSGTSNECVVHANADPKNYLSVFKFKGPPAGTGPITIKALVKFGLAFPNPTGMFWWPNNAHLTLTERAPVGQRIWYEGLVGESCITVCTKLGLGCDIVTMRSQGNSSQILAAAGMFSNCTGPVMPGCTAASPNVGAAGCFYHSDSCIQPAPQPEWVRLDPCRNLSAWSASKTYYDPASAQEPKCCIWNQQKWCARYQNQNNQPPTVPDEYGAWGSVGGGIKGTCMPAGGWPAGQGSVPVPPRTVLPATQTTCDATKTSNLDGQRICACTPGGITATPVPTGQPGQSRTPTVKGGTYAPTNKGGGTGPGPQIDSASHIFLPLATLLLPFIASL